MRVFTVFLMILVGAVFIVGPAKILAGLTPDYATMTFWVWIVFGYYIPVSYTHLDVYKRQTMNNSMIDFLKDAFHLNDVEKQLPNTFFYGAYVFSIPVGFLINKIGYKNGVLVGLGTIVLGFLMAIPLVALGYIPFLIAVSVLSLIHI